MSYGLSLFDNLDNAYVKYKTTYIRLRENTKSIFKNEKGDNDKRPDYKGDGKDMQGNTIEVAAWIKQGAKGKFMSCRFKVKGEQAERPKPAAESKNTFDDMPDDLPWKD